MQHLAPFADQLGMFLNQKLNDYMQSISYAYAVSLVCSLIFNTRLPCIPKKVKPLTYVLYIANCLLTCVRAGLCNSIFKTFNQLNILFTIVISVVSFILTFIQFFAGVQWPDIVVGVVYMLLLAAHTVAVAVLFKRLIRVA